MEDEKIVDLYWARSEKAVSETAAKYGKYCRTIAFNILASEEDAEECLNDTYMKAWNSMPRNRPSRLAPYGLDLRRTQTTTFGSHADYLKVYDLPEGMDRETWLSLDYNSSSTAEQLRRLSEGTRHGDPFVTDPEYIDHLYFFQEGSFGISGAFNLNNRAVTFYLYNSMYGTLSNGLEVFNEIPDVSVYSARTRQTADGTEVTILTGRPKNGLGTADTVYLYAYLENSFVVMTLDSESALTDTEIDGIADNLRLTALSA